MNQTNYSLIAGPKLLDFADVPAFLKEKAKAIIEEFLFSTQASTAPKLVHLSGIPGSGKSTYAEQFLQSHTNFAPVCFDNVLISLDGYKQDCARLGLKHAFTLWEVPARTIGYHLLQALLENKRNVLFDHSASFHNHLDLIDTVKNWGYVVEMHYLHCPLSLAWNRVTAREEVLQRHTPKDYLWQRQKSLDKLIPLYQEKVDLFLTIPIT